MVVGFSLDEVWANPKAFIEGYSIGWGLPAMDFDSPEAEKLLRKKITLNAKRYDGLRIDASWVYSNQPLKRNGIIENRKDYGSKILEIIDDEILKVKGASYNKENIMHEFLADSELFNMFEGSRLKPFVENRTKIITSDSMSSDWATVSAFRKRGWKDGSYIIGATNHDCKPMSVRFADTVLREEQAKILSESLGIPKSKLQNLDEFIKAKFAEPMRSKHNMVFFTDALGLEGMYKESGIPTNDYRIKVPKNYQDKYFKSLEKGKGFNVMDALEKAFIAEGLDKKEPELYEKIVKYRKILQEPEKGLNRREKILYSSLAVLGIALVALILSKVLVNKKAE